MARKPKLLTVNEAQSFDFDAFISDIRTPEFTRNLYRRADLAPRIAELDATISDVEKRLEQADNADDEHQDRGITDVNVAATLRERLGRLITEFNDLVEQFEASAIPFTFRLPDPKADTQRIRDMMTADGVPWDTSEDDPEKFLVFAQEYGLYAMSLMCTSHPMNVEQWRRLRSKVGELAFEQLSEAYLEAVKAAQPSAPFLPKPSPGPDSDPS